MIKMKRIFLGLCALFTMTFCYGKVEYVDSTKTLTVIGSTSADEIRPYFEATTLIIKDVDGLYNMAYQYAQSLPNLEKLVLPSDVTEIPNQTFKNCSKLNNVNWGDLINLKTIGEEAFMSTAIGPNFVVPNSVEEIKKGAFEACDSIKMLIFGESSQIKHIYGRAFYQSENKNGKLSDVYVNVKPAREIICEPGAFDKFHTSAQTQVGTVTTRLHYPSELFEYYVGTYKSKLYDQNYDVIDENKQWVLDENNNRIHSYGIVTQSVINEAFEKATNGWQEFFSSGIPVGTESLYRTYSDNVAYKVPYTSELQIYLVVGYDKEHNAAQCVQMEHGDTIPPKTGVIVHSNVVSTIYLEYVAEPNNTEAYDNERYPNNLYKGQYKNYLKPINGELHIDNVEIVNDVKTYRNYFFNKGTTAELRPGPDWKDEYKVLGWGFFRAVSADYRVFNKAFLHLPADMTEASSAHIDDSGNLPQDGAQAQSKNGFGLYIINKKDISTDVRIQTIKTDDSYYTLQGVKVDKPTKGIYIKGNKKVIVR